MCFKLNRPDCKNCHAKNGGASSRKTDETIQYLKNGFARINSECDAIAEKMKEKTGFVFVKHLYSSEELFYAVSRVEAFVDEMKDEIDVLELSNISCQEAQVLFSKKAVETAHRLEALHSLIEEREPTWWEKVKSVLKRIFDKLIALFPADMFAEKAMQMAFTPA